MISLQREKLKASAYTPGKENEELMELIKRRLSLATEYNHTIPEDLRKFRALGPTQVILFLLRVSRSLNISVKISASFALGPSQKMLGRPPRSILSSESLVNQTIGRSRSLEQLATFSLCWNGMGSRL
jgi:hypothetical protein